MAIVKSDPRFVADPEYVFATTILSADDLTEAKTTPAPSPSPPAQPASGGKIIVAAGAGAAAAGSAAAGAVHAMGGFPIWLIVVVGCAAAAIVAGAFWLRHRLRQD